MTEKLDTSDLALDGIRLSRRRLLQGIAGVAVVASAEVTHAQLPREAADVTFKVKNGRIRSWVGVSIR